MIVRGNEGGESWARLASRGGLAAVLDPADERGGKNRLIDRIHKRALSNALGEVRGRAVLDFGCGTGRLSAWLVGQGADVEGVDVTKEMIDVARRTVPGATFQVLDGIATPFPDATFDLVVSAYVLQYYVHGDGALPRELARVLRHRGRLTAIEQVTTGDLGRGGTEAAYERMLVAAGFEDVGFTTLRLGHSRIVELVRRMPAAARLPGLPRLVAAEARRSSRRGVAVGRYADVLVAATRV